mgnify:CR=1 FL=1
MGLGLTEIIITFILCRFRDIEFLPSYFSDTGIPLVLPLLYILYNIDRTTKYGRKISAAFVWAVLGDILAPKWNSVAQLAVFCRSIQFVRGKL